MTMAKTFAVAFQHNAKDIARQNHWRAERMRMTLQASADYNGQVLVQYAKELSNLTCHSLADLARMGHPYAKRAPNPPHPPRFIHQQRGRFFAAWYYQVKIAGNDISVVLGNRARTGPGGLALLPLLDKGTKKMIARGILSYVLRAKRLEIELNNRRGYRAALGLHGAAARSKASAYLAGLER